MRALLLLAVMLTSAAVFGQSASEHFQKGNEAYSARNWAEAERHYTLSINAEKSEGAHYNRGLARLNLGKHSDAAADMTAVINGGTQFKANAYYWRAFIRHSHLSQSEQALEDASQAITLGSSAKAPFPQQAYALRGQILLDQRKYADARTDLEKAISLGDQLSSTHTRLALALLRVGKAEEGLAQAERSLAIDSQSAWAHAVRAEALRSLKRDKDAEPSLRKAIELAPTYAFALQELGDLLYDRGDLKGAVEVLDKAISANPKSDFALATRGSAYRRLGEIEKSKADLNKAVEINPRYVWAFNELAVALLTAGENEQAAAAADKALAIDADYPWALRNKGVALKNLGKFEEADKALTSALAAKEDYADAYSQRGYVRRMLKQYEASDADLRRAISMDEDVAWAYNNLGLNAYDRDRLTEAKNAFDKSIAKNPNYKFPHYNRARLTLRLTFTDSAERDKALAAGISDITRAIELDEKNGEYWYVKSLIHREQKDIGAEKAALDRSLELDPNHANAHNNMGVYYVNVGKDDAKALEHFSSAARLDPKDWVPVSNVALLKAKLQQPWREVEQAIEQTLALRPEWRETASKNAWIRRYSDQPGFAELLGS